MQAILDAALAQANTDTEQRVLTRLDL